MPHADPDRAGADVVLIGSTTLLGAEIRRRMAERRFPLRDLAMMGEGEEIGRIVDFNGEARLVTELDPERLTRADLLILGAGGGAARRALKALRRGLGVAIDLVGVEAAGPAPVVNMEINAMALPSRRPARVCSPHGIVQVLSTTLAAIARKARIRAVSATVLTPVSEHGKAGVEELYRQTMAVLSFENCRHGIFRRQVAFNAIPHGLLRDAQGGPDLDARLQAEAAQVLGLDAEQVSIRAILVPVFHGTSLMVNVRFSSRVKPGDLPGRLGGDAFVSGPRTPAELEGSEAIHVVGLGEQPGGQLGLWIVADNLRCSGAGNGVRIAEALVARSGGKE
ncbi:MAG: Asd/ArgC dimerization domain-containing protein [Acidobacteriota bacterium]